MAALESLGVGKPDVPKWVQAAMDATFCESLPVTGQVKRLIVNSLKKEASNR